jgi:hypothetical protein
MEIGSQRNKEPKMGLVPLRIYKAFTMHQRIEMKNLGKQGFKLLFGLWMLVSSLGQLHAQAPQGIVFTDPDLGKEVKSSFMFSDNKATWNLTLKHRLGAVGPLEITSAKASQFDGSYQMVPAPPFTIMPGEPKVVAISINYSSAIKELTELVLTAGPVGEKDLKKLITVRLSLSAEGRLMFWEQNKRYASSLPTMVFDGAGDKLIELAWNGAGTGGACTVNIEGDTRGAFKVIPNSAGAQPIANGGTVNVSKSSSSYFIRYAGPGAKGSAADIGRVVIKDANGNSIAAEMFGTKKGGASAFVSKDPNASGIGKTGPLTFDVGKDPLKTTSVPVVTPQGVVTHNTGIPGIAANPAAIRVTPTNPNLGQASAKAKNLTVAPLRSPKGAIVNPDSARAYLEQFYLLHKEDDIMKVGEIMFREGEEFQEARFGVKFDTLMSDPNMGIKLGWVEASAGGKNYRVPGDKIRFDKDSMEVLVKLPDEIVDAVSVQDSFKLSVGFIPEYFSGPTGNIPVVLADTMQVFAGSMDARIYSESYFWLWVWIAIILFIVGIFVLGLLWINRPISSFRYLREAKYQRDRFVGRDEEFHIEIDPIHIDLQRHDTDLIQLSYNLHSNSGVTGQREEGSGKVRTLDATVTAPIKGAIYRFFLWFYGLFGRAKTPRFSSVYYSLRIEPIQGSIPQNLRLKDESGVLMLGTSLTGNVLATDHQDFRFTHRPFQYKVFLDPSEILEYNGTMRTVTIPFRVIEEPFEGYVMTRDFRLNLEIPNKG